MNLLIIGLGYAGTRFLNAFLSVDSLTIEGGLRPAYVGRRAGKRDIPYFSDVPSALAQWRPEIVVVAVTDGEHAGVLAQLAGYPGFVICEKPLANSGDDLSSTTRALDRVSGFCLNLVERYSEAAQFLKQYVHDHRLSLIRSHFIWGKDRIHDHRPTCGVPSEIIHALDLVNWIAAPEKQLVLEDAIGTTSNFSVSGDAVLDSVAIVARLGTSVVSGYSSFVNITRQRTLDFALGSPDGKLIYAQLIFDTPSWDIDHLRIWERTHAEDRVLAAFTTSFPDSPPSLLTIQKLRRLVLDVLGFAGHGICPRQAFADLSSAVAIQVLLNQIEHTARTTGPVKYVLTAARPIVASDGDLERLG
ncbi:Gfo/Idh/MocA family oxidoreductase [Burkholderia perseverans]|uniref:Gfo/Idh/MocA family oxidoreductase n=1 Tax=Burkholderia perseverans TaxID=2615214 RepID=UPI001FED6E27|nr:Gfo/Idh/MocA family oxidoreductase [Burkholderia perseverans]